MKHHERVIQARMVARGRVQREIGNLIGGEEAKLREACDRLFKWVAEKLDGGCEGCGE
jgi:hypothetical protein